MKAWKVTMLGEPKDVLQLFETTKPAPKATEAIVQVRAAALNFFDILQCQGKYQEKPPLPFTPGAEVSGTIIAVGEEIDVKIGQRVIATPSLPYGGLAEQVVVKKDAIYPIPESLSFSKAASMFITYQTAYYALHRCAQIKKGDILIVHAGSGGVGSAAIQLGVAAGAKVIATAGSEEKLEVCRKLGATEVINYRTNDFVNVVKQVTEGKGANIIFDPVGGDIFDRSRKCIAFEGRILVIGFAGGRIAEAPTNHALVKNYSIVGVHWGLFRRLLPQEVVKAHNELMRLFEKGAIDPLIFNEYHFEKVPQALHELADRKTWGKLVVTP